VDVAVALAAQGKTSKLACMLGALALFHRHPLF
jgi:hypothetical protein